MVRCITCQTVLPRTQRPDETPLEYLHRLNGAAIRAKVAVREGRHAARREHVEHFISTLDDRDLAKQLTLLRLTDVDDMEETLRAYQRIENRYKKAPMVPGKFNQHQKYILIKYLQNQPDRYER